jgi:hypothetical protein
MNDTELGHHHTIELSDRTIHVKSDAEAWFAQELDKCRQAGAVLSWDYEPESFPIQYRYNHQQLCRTYTPDFVVVWNPNTSDEGQVYIEVKRGWLTQKYANLIVDFCQQYPDKKLVLVWYGSVPKRGKGKRYLDKVKRYVHHVSERKAR